MKRKKRILAAVMAVLFLAVGVLGINLSEVKAATEAKITVSSAKGYEGDTITIDVSVTENPGMCGMTIGIKYDKSVLTVVDAVGADDVFSSNDAIVNPDGDGFVGYMYGGIKDKTTTGKLMTITFKINEGAAIADSTITIGGVNGNMEASNFNGDTVGLATEAGKVTVQCKHTSVKDIEKVAATCTTEGSIDTVCEKCGAVVKTTKKSALGHKYGEYTTTKEPTCTEEGVATSTCTVCGDKQTKELEALGHKYGEYTTTKEATCTEKGEATSICTVCGDKQTKELEALGHKFGDIAVTKEPTDKEDGEATSTCTVCGEKVTIALPMINVEDFDVLGSGDNKFLSEVVAGEETTITFVGVGMSNSAPKAGDVRYVPTSWKLDKEIKWDAAPYTATIKLSEAGNKEIVTVYSRQIYTGAEWKADGKTVSVKTAIKVSENTSGNPGASTGDTTGAAATILFMMCVISAGVMMVVSKKKARV